MLKFIQDRDHPSRACVATPASPRREFVQGITAALPLLVGVMPFGIVFGTLALAAGFSPAETVLMSALVFAGSAQFLAVGLFAANAAPIAIVLATLIINLRHLLYGMTLGPLYRGLPSRWLVALGFTTIDEVFILVQARGQRRPRASSPQPHLHWYAIGVAGVLYVGWQVATVLGILGGTLIPDPRAWGMDFALAATFIAFLVPQIRTRPSVVCAIVAATGALALRDLPLQSGLIAAILLGVGAALIAERIWPSSLPQPYQGAP